MPLASVEDVSRWITEDKLEVNEASIAPFNVEVERTIKAMLAGVFTSSVMASWVDTDTTPPLISSIAGKLIAAYTYRNAYSEDESAVPPYAQQLYREAVDSLISIRAGRMVVLDASDNPVSSTEPLTSLDFYPNNSAPGPVFTMDKEFA